LFSGHFFFSSREGKKKEKRKRKRNKNKKQKSKARRRLLSGPEWEKRQALDGFFLLEGEEKGKKPSSLPLPADFSGRRARGGEGQQQKERELA
jgi:hypothetical protein